MARLITTAVEHSATLKFCAHLQKQGCEVTMLPVNHEGGLDLGGLVRALHGRMRVDNRDLMRAWAELKLPTGRVRCRLEWN